jgi:hypothetical protein
MSDGLIFLSFLAGLLALGFLAGWTACFLWLSSKTFRNHQEDQP